MTHHPAPNIPNQRRLWLGYCIGLLGVSIVLSYFAIQSGLTLWQEYQAGYVHGLWGLLALRFGSVAVVLAGAGACALAAKWLWQSGTLADLSDLGGQPSLSIHGLHKTAYQPIRREVPTQLLGQVYAWRLRRCSDGQIQTRWVLLSEPNANTVGRWVRAISQN